MKPGGWGILLSPVDLSRMDTYEDRSINAPEGRKQHFGQSDHVRVYGADYAKRLSNIGFRVEEIDVSKDIDSEKFSKMSFSHEILYIVHK